MGVNSMGGPLLDSIYALRLCAYHLGDSSIGVFLERPFLRFAESYLRENHVWKALCRRTYESCSTNAGPSH